MDTDSKTESAVTTAASPQEAKAAPAASPQEPKAPQETKVDLATMKEMSIGELTKIAKSLDVPGATGMRKQEQIGRASCRERV